MRLSLLPILAALSPAAHGLLSGRDLHARDRTGFPDQWAGANSFFLHSYTQPEQTEIVTNLANAGIKVIRVFISTFNAGMKQSDSNVLSNNVYMQDLEYTNLGPNYNDQNLVALDWLMQLVASKGMKLILCAHDRWMLDGTWGTSDAYAHRWPNITNFYYDTAAQQTFDARLAHIATHVNPLMGNRQWKDIPEAIYAFEIQNEAQGSGLQSVASFNYDWTCGRATSLRAVIGNSPIYISNGGGQNGDGSNLQSFYNCAALDVVAIHDYDASDVQKAMKNGLATHPNKIVILEEFGAQGSSANKAAVIQAVGNAANSLRVSWMVWEAVKPGQVTKDYEFYVGDTEAWAALAAAAQLTQACQNGQCPVIQNVGCYLDSSNRAMPNAVTLPVQAVASVEICLSQCMASGFTYSGLENSKECYCSNAIPSIAASNCNMACAGNSKQICGGAWALSVYTAITTTIVGCFQDTPTFRTTSKQLSLSAVNPASCLIACLGAGYTYGGAEYSSQCYCFNSLPPAQLASSQCNMKCSGDASQTCGGPWIMTVASNGPVQTTTIVGCFQDTESLRASSMQVSLNSVTPASCLTACLSAGYIYGGAEYSSQCYCFNSLPPVQLAGNQCNMQCSGDANQTCGGPWIMTVASRG
ncbi:glycoside hydrolase superfamily [Chytriomyces sp. MP71]|nr:glycoside hydrolase superfamily [Chytriomyces sp. MP71]